MAKFKMEVFVQRIEEDLSEKDCDLGDIVGRIELASLNPVFYQDQTLLDKIKKLYQTAVDRISLNLDQISRRILISLDRFSDISEPGPQSHQNGTNFVNNITDRIVQEILAQESIMQRTKVLKRWAYILQKQFNNRNYQVVAAILGAFSNSAIKRLEASFASLPLQTRNAITQIENFMLQKSLLIEGRDANIIPPLDYYKLHFTRIQDPLKDKLREQDAALLKIDETTILKKAKEVGSNIRLYNEIDPYVTALNVSFKTKLLLKQIEEAEENIKEQTDSSELEKLKKTKRELQEAYSGLLKQRVRLTRTLGLSNQEADAVQVAINEITTNVRRYETEIRQIQAGIIAEEKDTPRQTENGYLRYEDAIQPLMPIPTTEEANVKLKKASEEKAAAEFAKSRQVEPANKKIKPVKPSSKYLQLLADPEPPQVNRKIRIHLEQNEINHKIKDVNGKIWEWIADTFNEYEKSQPANENYNQRKMLINEIKTQLDPTLQYVSTTPHKGPIPELTALQTYIDTKLKDPKLNKHIHVDRFKKLLHLDARLFQLLNDFQKLIAKEVALVDRLNELAAEKKVLEAQALEKEALAKKALEGKAQAEKSNTSKHKKTHHKKTSKRKKKGIVTATKDDADACELPLDDLQDTFVTPSDEMQITDPGENVSQDKMDTFPGEREFDAIPSAENSMDEIVISDGSSCDITIDTTIPDQPSGKKGEEDNKELGVINIISTGVDRSTEEGDNYLSQTSSNTSKPTINVSASGFQAPHTLFNSAAQRRPLSTNMQSLTLRFQPQQTKSGVEEQTPDCIQLEQRDFIFKTLVTFFSSSASDKSLVPEKTGCKEESSLAMHAKGIKV